MDRTINGNLEDGYVVIKDKKEGSRLYNRGYYGEPMSGGGLKLELIEGFYLLDNDKLRIFQNGVVMSLEDLLTYITKREPTFEIKYIVYRDLRVRGHTVKPSNISDFVVYGTKGSGQAGPNKKELKYWATAFSERARFRITEIIELITIAKNTRKELLVSVVDEEGDLTYYSISFASPSLKGRSKQKKHKLTGTAVLVEDRVMLWDPALISELRSIGFYGKLIGKSLQLALTESAYLMEQGILVIQLARTRRKVSLERFIRIATKIQPDFGSRLQVYRELKSRHMIVKTGFKYGAHFRVYAGDPDDEHSDYLVHGIPENFECSWEEISRAVRLAHGVRKHMLFGRIMAGEKGEIEYIKIERVKP